MPDHTASFQTSFSVRPPRPPHQPPNPLPFPSAVFVPTVAEPLALLRTQTVPHERCKYAISNADIPVQALGYTLRLTTQRPPHDAPLARIGGFCPEHRPFDARWALRDLLVQHDRRDVWLVKRRQPGEHLKDELPEGIPIYAFIVPHVADNVHTAGISNDRGDGQGSRQESWFSPRMQGSLGVMIRVSPDSHKSKIERAYTMVDVVKG
ncbi:hypothetical protein BD310DRAFT_971043 [Dichomitus squalens]|uniref:Uncharacterized protein n=1 Tax=Dichomitus squalens TaxID=114155 RepID=A0A4Q9PH15_9APHY|nr:hypothetical protein BD310DRAFT_971043 [Dichomitus squalens]